MIRVRINRKNLLQCYYFSLNKYIHLGLNFIFDQNKTYDYKLLMAPVNNILIRLPNWLGDMVMATSFVKAVKDYYPEAEIDLIAKQGLESLLDYFPIHHKRFVFSKNEFEGLKGARAFGKRIRKEKKYDLFFCLPDSLSAATMGAAINAKKSIGFKKNVRFLLLTNIYKKQKNLHRVAEYIDLLSQFLKQKIDIPPVVLQASRREISDALVININSEASSRRLPKEKAISIINAIRNNIDNRIVLVASPSESSYVNDVFDLLDNKKNIINFAGQTSLPELVQLFASCRAVLSTDSGPAHLSNALGKKTLVLFGAGNENNTAPFNKEFCKIIRLGKLACEPCVNNACELYGIPECLLQLDENLIVENLKKFYTNEF